VRSNRDDSGDLLSQKIEFTWVDWQRREHKVWREEFNLVASDQMSWVRDGPPTKKVERLISEREKQQRPRLPPSEDLINFRTAQLLLVPHVHVKRDKGISKPARFQDSKDGKAGRKRKKFLSPFFKEDLNSLCFNSEDQAATAADLLRRTPEEEAAMQAITGWMHLSQKWV